MTSSRCRRRQGWRRVTGRKLKSEGVLKLWRGLVRTRTTLQNFPPRRTLAMEQVAVSAGTSAAVLGTGAGAIYVLTGPGKPPEAGQSPGATKGAGGGFKAFTEANFRENLSRLTGERPENVHDPRFGAWWEKSSHLKKSVQYSLKWQKFLEDPRTFDEILQYGRDLAGDYGFQVYF
jgi:hypothetical protein